MVNAAFFVTCPKGFEDLLQAELMALGATESRIGVGGVHAKGDALFGMSVALHSRLANRLLMPLAEGIIRTPEDLYALAQTVAWNQWVMPHHTLAVDYSGEHPRITNTQFGALKVKDAVVDYWREQAGDRPDVARQQPDYRIVVRLHKGVATLSLDWVGGSLHERGYRKEQGAAPLKENLAAAILLRLNWPEIAAAGGSLVDPMCGAGTFLIEAALMALQIAPGIFREGFAFTRWLPWQAEPLKSQWQSLLAEAQAAATAATLQTLPPIVGSDHHGPVLRAAQHNIERAGLSRHITVLQQRLTAIKNAGWPAGLVVVNPPYGERLGEQEALKDTYFELAQQCKTEFQGWQLGVFTANPTLAQHLRLRAHKKNRFFNGPLPCELLHYALMSADKARLREGEATEAKPWRLEPTPGSEMLANRLRKNIKRLAPWVAQGVTDAYRLYDADMPEYAAAIDLYAGQIHLQEYAAPKTIPEADAKRRFSEVIQAVCEVFETSPDRLAIKVRERHKGQSQYEKHRADAPDIQVREGRARFYVNLHQYLDTGLFLDHRPLRLRLAEEMAGKRFLNLFCYTATATCQAIFGGARASVSVDMSRTYLSWASRNFELNRIHSADHELIQADCLTYLEHCRDSFDVILLDPPSFSNSKRLEQDWDVQRDHVAVVDRCMSLLRPGGCLYFSNNLQSFRLDSGLLQRYRVEDLSAATRDRDFERNPKIHQCYRLQALAV